MREKDLRRFFEENFRKLGYDRILKSSLSSSPDFVMEKGGEEVKVELELNSQHFYKHRHDPSEVDELIFVRGKHPSGVKSTRIPEHIVESHVMPENPPDSTTWREEDELLDDMVSKLEEAEEIFSKLVEEKDETKEKENIPIRSSQTNDISQKANRRQGSCPLSWTIVFRSCYNGFLFVCSLWAPFQRHRINWFSSRRYRDRFFRRIICNVRCELL